MRLSIELLLNENKISKDKNRIVMHIVKLLLEKENKELYQALYKDYNTSPKDLNFAIYLGNGAKFLRNEIKIPSQKIIVNFSTSDPLIGISIYNLFIKHKGLEIPIENNTILINKVNTIRTRPIIRESSRFITKAPIAVRSHKGDNRKTRYHSLSSGYGRELFLTNLKQQLQSKFPEINKQDLDNIKVNIIWNRDVNVKHYDIVILSNLCEFEMEAKTYILEEIYLNGIGSRKSQGFGFLDLVKQGG